MVWSKQLKLREGHMATKSGWVMQRVEEAKLVGDAEMAERTLLGLRSSVARFRGGAFRHVCAM